MINRRTLLRAGASAAVTLLPVTRARAAADADVEITLPSAGGPVISRHIYGHFIEHLGGVIYDGIWVGRNSKIANTGGIRTQFIDDMKRIGAPNFRWPGGCFADGYHWRDGLGPTAKRPRTYNYWQASMPPGLDHTETNAFGLHEFMQLCRLTGAEPYLAANMGAGSPQEFHDWVSYCNAPTGTLSLASERAANGDPAPFNVQWWGVGNESWGCGGDMTPGEYATLYRRFVTQYPSYAPKPVLVAVGPRGHSKDLDLAWTAGFGEAMKGHKSPVDGLSLHYYTDFRNSPENVAKFDAGGWYDVLREGVRTETVIEQHWQALSSYDPQHHVKLVVDEWGVWYKPGEEIRPGYLLSQPLTLRDALHTAITFDVFNRHADKISMANVAQTVNCIHSLVLAGGSKYVRTPVYDVFAMYRGHMGALKAPVRVRSEELQVESRRAPGRVRMPGLSCSASFAPQQKLLRVTMTNPSLDGPLTVRLRTSGTITESRATVLTHADMTARNSFERPTEVQVKPLAITGTQVTLPPRSVAALELRVS